MVTLLRATLIAAALITPAAATDYFVSATGNDGLAGTTPATAWFSLARVQQAQGSLQPGDRVLFRAGDRFEGHLILNCSGTASAPIVFGSFGTGAKPRLVASTALTGWTSMGSGAWTTPNPLGGVHPEALFLGGQPLALGREPDHVDTNGGYRTIDASVGHTTVVDADLPSTPNWTGAEAVVRTQRWILDRVRVQSHSGTNLQLVAPGTFPYPIQPAFGFFLQDHPEALDQHLEWCFVGANQELRVFLEGNQTPSDYEFRIPLHDHVLRLVGTSDLTVEGLHLLGARSALVSGTQVTRVVLQDCRLSSSGGDGAVLDQAVACILANCVIKDCQNNGVQFAAASQCILQDSTLLRISLHAGMGRATDGNSFGVLLEGGGNQIVRNRILDVGYIGIGANGPSNSITRNHVARFCSTKDDGGGIYVSGYGPGGTQGTRVEDNLLLDGIGAGLGTYPSQLQAAHGVYIDDFADDVSVARNAAAHCGSYGIFVHNAINVVVRKNTCFANKEAQLAMIEDSIAPTDIRGASVRGNVFCAREESALAAVWSSEQDDIQEFGTFSRNAYVQLYRDSGYLKREFRTAFPGGADRCDGSTPMAECQRPGLELHAKPIRWSPATLRGLCLPWARAHQQRRLPVQSRRLGLLDSRGRWKRVHLRLELECWPRRGLRAAWIFLVHGFKLCRRLSRDRPRRRRAAPALPVQCPRRPPTRATPSRIPSGRKPELRSAQHGHQP